MIGSFPVFRHGYVKPCVLDQMQQRKQVRVKKFPHVLNRKGSYQSFHSNVTSGKGMLRLAGTPVGKGEHVGIIKRKSMA